VLGGVPLGGVFAYSAGAPVLIITHLGLRPTYYGLLVAFTVSGIITGSYVVRRTSTTLGPVRLLGAGVSLVLGGGIAMLAIVAMAPSIGGVIGAAFIYMLGMGIVIPAASGLAMQQVAPQEAATAGALSGALHMLFGAAGAMWVSLTTTLPAAGFPLVMATMGVVGIVLWLAIRRFQTS
jgi:DHA1 family bicyclomycin/chloramphenicol resistance-like MFS transporter